MKGAQVWDVHAHYLPRSAFDLMSSGQVRVLLETVDGTPDSITINGIAAGATAGQLSEVDGIIEATDRAEIDRRVLSPPPFTYRYWNEPAASLELCQLINEATAEVARSHPDRFLGLATVPLQDTEQAIVELRRARDELGLVGVTVGTNVAGANVSDDPRRLFLAEAERLGMPILVHPDFVPNPRLGNYYLINVLGMPTESATTMANMLFSGVFEEYPDLRVCFMHGGGTAPYLFGRWDTAFRVRPESRIDIEAPPTSYLGNIFCDTLTHSPTALSYLVDVLGEENVVLGTDLPFDVEDPDPRAHVRRAPRLDEEQIKTIETVSPLRWLNGANPR